MKWNLRMAAAQRDVWKASQLHAMLADAGLVISAGKMSHLWSGRPVTVRLEDLQVICSSWNRTRPEADRPGPSSQSCGPPPARGRSGGATRAG